MTLTDAGMETTFGLELVRRTVSPVVGVGPVKVTVPVTATFEPPITVPGEHETLWIPVGVT